MDKTNNTKVRYTSVAGRPVAKSARSITQVWERARWTWSTGARARVELLENNYWLTCACVPIGRDRERERKKFNQLGALHNEHFTCTQSRWKSWYNFLHIIFVQLSSLYRYQMFAAISLARSLACSHSDQVNECHQFSVLLYWSGESKHIHTPNKSITMACSCHLVCMRKQKREREREKKLCNSCFKYCCNCSSSSSSKQNSLNLINQKWARAHTNTEKLANTPRNRSSNH